MRVVFFDLCEEELSVGWFEGLDFFQQVGNIEQRFVGDADVVECSKQDLGIEIIWSVVGCYAGFFEERIELAHDGGCFHE